MNRISETNNYFSQSLQWDGVNLQSNIGSPLEDKDYWLVFYKSWLHSFLGYPFARISNPLKPKPMQTVITNINLTKGELSILNSKSNGGATPQAIAGNSNKMRYILKNRKVLANAKSIFEQTYSVDPMVDAFK